MIVQRMLQSQWYILLLALRSALGQNGSSGGRVETAAAARDYNLICPHETSDFSSDVKGRSWVDKLCEGKNSTDSLCREQPCLTRNETYLRGQACDGIFDCTDLTDECLCEVDEGQINTAYRLCREVLRISQGTGDACPVGYFSCDDIVSGSATCKHSSIICDGRRDCGDCSDEFFCANDRNITSICGDEESIRHFTYEKTESYASADFRDGRCYRCPDYQTNSEGLRYLKYIDRRRRFDGVPDCEKASDEWHDQFVFCGGTAAKGSQSRCYRTEGDRYFSTPQNASRWPVFSIMQLVIGIPTVLANVTVAIATIKVILQWRWPHASAWRGKPKTPDHYTRSKICNTILVLCLCIADLIFGVQMILLGAANLYLQGEYWREGNEWLASVTCEIIGSMCILATQASALTIFTLAMFRLISVLRPFQPAEVKHAIMAFVGIWLVAVIIMAIPLVHLIRPIENYFLYAAEVPNHPTAGADVLERADLVEYVRKVDILARLSHGRKTTHRIQEPTDMTLAEMEHAVKAANPQFAGWKFFGFYSRYSICMPPVFSSTTDPSWKYPVSVLCLNFAEYLFVMFAYLVIGKRAHTRRSLRRKTVTPTKAGNRSRNSEDSQMQRRILWLVITDFICWVPICTLSFITCLFPDAEVGGSASLMLVIVLAEVDSLINPLLYYQRSRELARSVVLSTARGSIASLHKVFGNTRVRVEPEVSETDGTRIEEP